MAELAGDGYGYDDAAPRPWRRQAALALGAAASLALVWALVSWGHGLVTRDAGAIPFLKAEDGPFKIPPEDPEGMEMDEADRAVETILAGEAPEETALAPADEMPAAEDLPAPLLDEAAPAESAEAADEDPIEAAVQRALSQEGAEDGAQAETEGQAPAVSPPAPMRPRDIAALRARQAAEPAAPEAAPAPAAGDDVVQLGAFNTAEIAESQWRRHQARNEDLLGPLGHAVTTVESGGRTLYRLRAGPLPDRKRAQELCAALKARGDACITARMR